MTLDSGSVQSLRLLGTFHWQAKDVTGNTSLSDASDEDTDATESPAVVLAPKSQLLKKSKLYDGFTQRCTAMYGVTMIFQLQSRNFHM